MTGSPFSRIHTLRPFRVLLCLGGYLTAVRGENRFMRFTLEPHEIQSKCVPRDFNQFWFANSIAKPG
jgi:hypothetical protein